MSIIGNIKKEEEKQIEGDMSKDLHTLLTYFIQKMKNQADNHPRLFEEVFNEKNQKEELILQVLRAFLYACEDAHNNTPKITKILPNILYLFQEKFHDKSVKLISGIMNLRNADKDSAIEDLSDAFKCD